MEGPGTGIAPAASVDPPYDVRASILTPLASGGISYLRDGRMRVSAGLITDVRAWADDPPLGPIADATARSGASDVQVVDLRPGVVMPGMVDLHAHLPQVPNAGLGAGMDLLAWLERYIFPLEREFDVAAAQRLAPLVLRAFAAAGTTTAVVYGAVFEDSLDTCFAAAEEHGMRVVMGKVMMDRLRYDPALDDTKVLEVSLAQTQRLIERWHGRDNGRLMYAVTPRFAVSCSPEMLRESAALAASTGAYWQTHLAEDRNEIETVAKLFPDARDYTDVYDAAGGLGPRSIMAHAVRLSEREVARLAETGTRVAHCPSSNLFLASGAMPLARYLEAGLVVGLGSDVAAGPDLSLFSVMRAGAYTQNGLVTMLRETRPALKPLEWLRLGTLDGARALGLEDSIGSLEPGKEADFICVDTESTAPIPGTLLDGPEDICSRLIYRSRPDMVTGAWVRGRRLPA